MLLICNGFKYLLVSQVLLETCCWAFAQSTSTSYIKLVREAFRRGNNAILLKVVSDIYVLKFYLLLIIFRILYANFFITYTYLHISLIVLFLFDFCTVVHLGLNHFETQKFIFIPNFYIFFWLYDIKQNNNKKITCLDNNACITLSSFIYIFFNFTFNT